MHTITAEPIAVISTIQDAYTVQGLESIYCTIDYRHVPFLWYSRNVGNDNGTPILHLYQIINGESVPLYVPEITAWVTPLVSPLPNNSLLVVRQRSSSADERNATVYGANGLPISSFHAGDDIVSLQVADNGDIWIGYGDEGIFGDISPLSHNGLVCLDIFGSILFNYDSDIVTQYGVPTIAHCYGLNVHSPHEIWVYYYNEFPMVHLVDHEFIGLWYPKVSLGAKAFAINEQMALFADGYDSQLQRSDRLVLCSQSSEIVNEFQITTPAGHPLSYRRNCSVGRGSCLYLRGDDQIYRVNLDKFS